MASCKMIKLTGFFCKYTVVLTHNILGTIYRTNRNISTRIQYSRVLGIETSCDDTGCAIVDVNAKILGESLCSQNVVHIKFGGINPTIAHDLHRNNIKNVVNEALTRASLDIHNIDAIAVTVKPGLLFSLQVGVKYAKYLARLYKKPLIPIHHMEAHSLVARMYYNIPFPFLVLLISGGHCLLAVVKNVTEFLLLGESLDNAPGEVMDKAARRMKLKNIPAYSQIAGGRAIELAAKTATDPELFQFPLPLARTRDCNFSFSGLKESFLSKLIKKEMEHNIKGDGIIPEVNDLCAGFQLAIAEHIAHRTERAVMFCEMENFLDNHCRNIVVSGGVACNDFIFKAIQVIGNKTGFKVWRPPPNVCTDNGIMIAWNGIEKLEKRVDIISDITLKSLNPKAPLGISLIDKVQKADLKTRVTRLKKLYLT